MDALTWPKDKKSFAKMQSIDLLPILDLKYYFLVRA